MTIKELKDLLETLPDNYVVSAWLQDGCSEVYVDLTLNIERDDYQKEIIFKNFK